MAPAASPLLAVADAVVRLAPPPLVEFGTSTLGAADKPVLLASVALVLAAVAIFIPPVSFLALIALAFLLVRGRQEGERKYAGLRILR